MTAGHPPPAPGHPCPKRLRGALWVVLLATGACAPQSPEPEAPGPSRLGSAVPGDGTGGAAGSGAGDRAGGAPSGTGAGTGESATDIADRVIARMGAEAVTWGDVDRAIRQEALLRGVPLKAVADAARLRDPFFLWSTVDGLLQRRRLIREGERLGLTPSLDELLEAWRDHPELAPLLVRRLDEVEQRLQDAIGLGVDDVYEILRAEVIKRRWLDGVVAELDDERLWAQYQWQERTVTLDAIAIPNVPSSRELADFIAAPPEPGFIEAEYEGHPSRYTIRPTVDAWVVRIPLGPEPDPVAEREARRQLEALRAQVEGGMAIADLSVAAPVTRERLEHVGDGVLPQAFRQEIGEVGPITAEEEGLAFLQVEAFQPPVLRPLDDILRREIASNALTRLRVLGQAGEVASAVQEALAAGDEAGLEAIGHGTILRRRTLGPMRRELDGLLPGMGRSEDLTAWLFEVAAVGEVTPEPALVDGMVWVVQLEARNEPMREAFEADRERFAAEAAALVRSSAWEAFWARCQENEPIQFQEGGPDP